MADDEKPIEDTSIQLTPEERVAITDHINRLAVPQNDACVVCGSPNNGVAPHVYRLDVATDPLALGGAHQPLVATACGNCGYVRFFNKKFLDVLIENHAKSLAVGSHGEDSDGN